MLRKREHTWTPCLIVFAAFYLSISKLSISYIVPVKKMLKHTLTPDLIAFPAFYFSIK